MCSHSPPHYFCTYGGVEHKYFDPLGAPPPHGKTFYTNKNYFWELGVGCTKRIGYHSIEYPDKTEAVQIESTGTEIRTVQWNPYKY
jgi:hypothetical protein